jgi:DNA-binding transcriptional LysR family regulator
MLIFANLAMRCIFSISRLIRAVRAGMGLALVPHCLVQDDIAAGLVSTPLDDGYKPECGDPPGR